MRETVRIISKMNQTGNSYEITQTYVRRSEVEEIPETVNGGGMN